MSSATPRPAPAADSRIAVLGSGSWGTALAISAARAATDENIVFSAPANAPMPMITESGQPMN